MLCLKVLRCGRYIVESSGGRGEENYGRRNVLWNRGALEGPIRVDIKA